MNNIDCGRVCLIDKGAFNAYIQYEVMDLVRYNDGVYFCNNTPPSAGVLPTNTNYFSALVESNPWDLSGAQSTYRDGVIYWEVTSASRYDYEYMVYLKKNNVQSSPISLVVDLYRPNDSYCVKNADSNDIMVWSATLEERYEQFGITATIADSTYTERTLYRRKRTANYNL